MPDMGSLPIEESDVKKQRPNHSPKTSKVPVKRKVDLTKLPAKKAKKQLKPAKKAKKQPKPTKKAKKKQAKQKVYKPKFIVTPPRETLSSEEEEFNSEAEPFSSEDEWLNPIATFQDELITIARQHKGFGPKIMYE